MTDIFDVVVLGAGSTGEVAAGRCRERGLSVVIVESELAGGECSYWACMPSKAMLRPNALLQAARRVEGAKQAVSGKLDAAAVLARRQEIVSNYDDSGQADWIKSVDVELVRGVGRLDGERKVVVTMDDGGTRTLTANKAVIVATGSSPVIPPIEGLREVEPWTNREATSAKVAPRRLAVIGGGYVGAEMAQAWKNLGSESVTMLVRGERLLENAEPFAADAVKDAFDELGIDVRFGVNVTKASRDASGVSLTLDDNSTLVVDEVLVATGRHANVADIGLDSVGVPTDQPIEVNDQLQSVQVPWLYAPGDVNGRAPLTHMGKYEARLVADAIGGRTVDAYADHLAVPSVIFTDPQVAAVGKTMAVARRAGLNVREVKVDLRSVAAASINNEDGAAQLVVDEDRKVIVGATFVGPEVGEMLHAATIAIVGEVPLDKLWHAVPSYPTISEVWLRLLEAYGL